MTKDARNVCEGFCGGRAWLSGLNACGVIALTPVAIAVDPAVNRENGQKLKFADQGFHLA